MKFAVQTAVLPELSMRDVVEKLAAHGYDAVEWRIHPDYHVAPGDLPGRAAEIATLCSDHGLAVSCLMGYAPLADLGMQRAFAEACQIMRCPRYRPGAVIYDGSRAYAELFSETVDALGAAIEIAAPYGVKPVVETHFRTIAPSASLALRLVEHFDPRVVGVNYDPANMVIEGWEPPRMAVELLGPYLDYVHAKNIAWVREDEHWRWVFASLAEGRVDWAEVAAALAHVGYDDCISFENFHLVPMTSTGFVGEDLTQRVAAFRDIDKRLVEDLAFLRARLA